MKNSKEWLTVHVVSCIEKSHSVGEWRLTIGAYASVSTAVRECAKYIVEQVPRNVCLTEGLANYTRDPRFADAFEKNGDGKTNLTDAPLLKKLLMENLKEEMVLIVNYDDSDHYFRFDIDECGIEGKIPVHTVISQISGGDDAPAPETFFTEKAALSYAEKEVKDIWRFVKKGTPEEELQDSLKNEFINSLKNMGNAIMALRDDLELEMSLWSHVIGGITA